MPNGIPHDSPEEYKTYTRAENILFVTMKYAFDKNTVHSFSHLVVSMFDSIFKILSESEEQNIAKIKTKYPSVFDKYFDTYYFFKELVEVNLEDISVTLKGRTFEYTTNERKVQSSYHELKDKFAEVESFYKLYVKLNPHK